MFSKRGRALCCRGRRSRGRNSWRSWTEKGRRPPKRVRIIGRGLLRERLTASVREDRKTGKKTKSGANSLKEEKKTDEKPCLVVLFVGQTDPCSPDHHRPRSHCRDRGPAAEHGEGGLPETPAGPGGIPEDSCSSMTCTTPPGFFCSWCCSRSISSSAP